MKTKKKFNLGPLQKKWLALLEGGLVKQTRENLCVINRLGNKKYCCLGVAADLVLHRNVTFEGEIGFIDGDEASLIKYRDIGMRGKFGELSASNTEIPKDAYAGDCEKNPSLANLNDNGWSFKGIAKFVRENPEAVFNKSV